MQPENYQSSNSLSCLACKRLKRKCSRDQPTCSLCRKTNRICRYPDDQTADDLTQVSALRARIRQLEGQLSQALGSDMQHAGSQAMGSGFSAPEPSHKTNALPADQLINGLRQDFSKLVLDSVAFRNSESRLWQGIEASLSQQIRCSSAAAQLFAIIQNHVVSTHVWLPIISIGRMKKLVEANTFENALDVNILFKALHLLNPSDTPIESSSYTNVKAGLESCGSRGVVTLNVLAATVIVAQFEMANAIYPEAYMTVGACSRLSHLLGLHDPARAVQILPNPDTWIAREERRRLWWATIILDRCVTAGFRFRPLSTAFIPKDEILPGSDDSWDRGEPNVNPLLVMSGQMNHVVAPYAKTCQASHLLGRVIQHVNYEHNLKEQDSEMHLAEAQQLHRATSAFITDLDLEYHRATRHQKLRLATPRAIAYSALLNLYDLHCCIEGDTIKVADDSITARLEMQDLALQQQKHVAVQVVNFGREIITMLNLEGRSSVSPLVCDSVYQAAAYFAWNYRETGSNASLDSLNELRQVLASISFRWRIAGKHEKTRFSTDADEFVEQIRICNFLREQSIVGKAGVVSDA